MRNEPSEPSPPGSTEAPKKRGVSNRARFAMLTSIGFMFPMSIVIGGAFGYFLDGRFGTLPWFSALFLLFGIAAAFINLFRMLRKFDELG